MVQLVNSMRVILICGKARSGKDTVAKIMSECISTDFMGNKRLNNIIIPNAKSVKRVATEKFNWNGVKDQEGRQLLINITERGYKEDEYHWEKETYLDYLMSKVSGMDTLIIPDWRYMSTLNYFSRVLKVEEIITIRVTRQDTDSKGTHVNHSSENDHLGFMSDYVINNDSTMEQLSKEVSKLCKHIDRR